MRRLAAAVTLLSFALVGCSSDGKEAEPVTIAFGGDVEFAGVLKDRLKDPATALGPVADQLKKADLAMINLLKPGAQELEAVKAAGVDVASVAEAAAKPHVVEVRGSKIAFFGGTDAALIDTVKGAKAQYDSVIVYLRWGAGKQSCPSDAQKTLADQLVAAGADVVVGSQAEVLQAGGFLKPGKFVQYGLGNLARPQLDGPAAQSGILTLTLKGHTVTNWDWAPAVIEGGLPRPLVGIPAQAAFGQWSALSACAGLSPE